MPEILQNGVNLHVISTEKYKTIRILVRFTARHSKQGAARRTLLTSLMETNSLNYPDQNALSSQLAQLYGASFGINVGKKGSVHQVNVSMNLVNGKYVGDPQLFKEGTDFLQEIIFSPNIENGQFNEETYRLEKDNMLSYLRSVSEDKQAYASLRLQELFFAGNEDQREPSFGSIAETEDLTNEDLVATYQNMLAEDQVDIFVVGDIQPEEAAAVFKAWPFPQEERVHPEIFYFQPTTNVIAEDLERDDLQQAKLNLGYSHDIDYTDPRRFALMVFNGLFGGFPHSKLFLNVREKASMAYYASSNFDTFRGLLSVQTGIDGENREKVLHLINQQLESIRQGDFSEADLQQTKVMLKNQFLLSQDSPVALIDTEYLNTWLPQTKLTEEQFLQALEAVTGEQVQAVAEGLRLQAIFFLEGGSK